MLVGGKSKQKQTVSAPWLLTFADLLSLVLTFFVLVFSMNTVTFESWKAVVHTMSEEFNPLRPAVDPVPHDAPASLMTKRVAGLNLSYLETLLSRQLKRMPLFQDAEVYRRADTVVISLPGTLMFERKQAVLAPDAARAMRQLAGALVQIRNRMQVAAHTDAAPVSTGLYRSNWELSMTRARVVAGALADSGYLQPITVLGYADSRSTELDQSLAGRNRTDWAERIDIVLINEKRGQSAYDIF